MLPGSGCRFFQLAATFSAYAPWDAPKTRSPGLNGQPGGMGESAATFPANSEPRTCEMSREVARLRVMWRHTYEWEWRLRLVLALRLQNLAWRTGFSGNISSIRSRRTSKKFIPALYTSTSTWSDCSFGSGASCVRGILDGCTYFSITKARMLLGGCPVEEWVVRRCWRCLIQAFHHRVPV